MAVNIKGLKLKIALDKILYLSNGADKPKIMAITVDENGNYLNV
jgi:hypothetical protein